jgi:hypothetical protein
MEMRLRQPFDKHYGQLRGNLILGGWVVALTLHYDVAK